MIQFLIFSSFFPFFPLSLFNFFFSFLIWLLQESESSVPKWARVHPCLSFFFPFFHYQLKDFPLGLCSLAGEFSQIVHLSPFIGYCCYHSPIPLNLYFFKTTVLLQVALCYSKVSLLKFYQLCVFIFALLFDSLGWWLYSHFHHQFPVFVGCYLSASHESGVFQVSPEFPCGIGCWDIEWWCFFTPSSTCKYDNLSY